MPGTSIGSLDRRVTIRRATISYSAFNEPLETWQDYATVWASRRDASAAESFRAGEVGAEISVRFTVRYNATTATVNPRDRVSFGGREYNITAARDVGGRNKFREIDAVARAQSESGYEPAGSP